MARKRFFSSLTDKYWYDLDTGEIDGRLGEFHVPPVKEAGKRVFGHTDNLPGGVNGIINHADGKRYDSRSQYEAAVRSRGCRVVGNDLNDRKHTDWKPPLERGVQGDYNVRPALKEAVHKVLGT